jgi:lipoprotein NlpI
MKKSIAILALCVGVAQAGAACAQNAPGMDVFQSLERPRVVPPPPSKQSPAATACATGGGRVSLDARLATCTSLIDSGKWKGRDIAWAYANRAAVHDAQGQADKALADCDKALALDPDLILPHQIRGDIWLKRGETAKALADYDAAIQRGASYAGIFIDRGNLLLASGETDKAIADFDRALALNPKSGRALVARGGALFTAGDFLRARADLDTAIEREPGAALAWFNRGSVDYALGDRAKAAENFRQAQRLDAKNAYAALWLFIASDGEAAKAELAAQAKKLAPTAWPRPVVQFYLGEKDAAQLLAAATTAAERCEAQFYLGQQKLLAGAGEQARPFLQQAVDICPKDFSEFVQAKIGVKSLDAAPKSEVAPPLETQAEEKKNDPADASKN